MDFLFVSLFEWAKEAGYDTFNLGLSALSGVDDAQDDPALERALHYICEHIAGRDDRREFCAGFGEGVLEHKASTAPSRIVE